MAGLLDLFSGRSSDIYGEGLLTPEQRGGLGNIGLLALAGKLGQLAGPSFSPVPDFGAALGQAAGAYGASQEGAGTAALNAILTGQKGRKLQQELEFGKQLQGSLPELMRVIGGLSSGGGEGSGSTGGAAAAPLGAGGGGSANGTYWTPEGLAALRPTEGRYDQIHYPSGNPSTASGAYGFLDSTWREQAAKAGVDINKYPRAYLAPPEVQDRVAAITPIHHWTGVDAQGKPFNAAAQRLATNRAYVAGGAAPTAAPSAAAPAAGGGLLNLPDPTGTGARAGFGLPQGAGPPTPGQGASEEPPPGFAGRQLVAQLLNRPPIDDVSQYQQVAGPGGGDAPGPAMAAGLLTPGGPLTRGSVPGMPAMPAAPTPANDPGLQLGPLAPAPAAAAPAAAGPGLLAPPGALPAAPALPRGANPAYGNVSNLLGILGVQAEAAGLKNVFAPLADAFRQSPAFQAQLEREKARVGVEFAGPRTTAEKTAAEPFAIAASDRELKNALIKEGWQIDEKGNAIPIPNYNTVAEAKANAIATGTEKPKLESALAQQGRQLLYDANGKPVIVPITGAAEAEARAARLKAEAEAGEKSKFDTEKVTVLGPDGRNQEIVMSKYDIAQQRQKQAQRTAAGTVAPQPGDIVGTPTFTDFEKGVQSGGVKWIETQHAAADTAAKNIEWNNESLKLIDSGMFVGWGSPVALQFARIFNIGGKTEQEKVQNTQKFLLERGQQVAAQINAMKGAASEGDRLFAEKMALGDMSLDESTIRQMLELYNKYNRQTVDQYNSAISTIRPDVLPGQFLNVPIAASLPPMDDTTRKGAEEAIRRNPKAVGPIRNKIRAAGMDPSGLY